MSDFLSDQSPNTSQGDFSSSDAGDVLVQYERACAEMRSAGLRLHRQMQSYEAVLSEIARLEADDTPQAREKLRRLEALVQSEAFQRDEREIRRMSAALAHCLERMIDDSPTTSESVGRALPVKRAVTVRRTCA